MYAMALSYPRLCIPQLIALDLPFETGSYKPRPVLPNSHALFGAWQARFEQICGISWPSQRLLHKYYTKLCHVDLDPKHCSTLETVDCSDSQPFYNAHLVSLAGKKKG